MHLLIISVTLKYADDKELSKSEPSDELRSVQSGIQAYIDDVLSFSW